MCVARGTITAILCLCANLTQAQDYATNGLQELASLHLPDNAITVSDSAGRVTHIGYDIFPAEMTCKENSQALRFVERYLLELDMHTGIVNADTRMETDKVSILVDGHEVHEPYGKLLNKGGRPVSLQVNETVRKSYSIEWQDTLHAWSATFPMDYQLLTGCNIIELEQNFIRDLQAAPAPPFTGLVEMKKGEMLLPGKEYSTICGEEYLSTMIRADRYVKGDSITLIASPQFPRQSIINILATGQWATDIPTALTVSCYSRKEVNLQVPLQKIIVFMQDEGCDIYVGIKTETADMMTATVFAYNPHCAYNHLLSCEVPISILDSEKAADAVVKAKARVYIPLQNLPEKYFDHPDIKDNMNQL